MRPPHKTRHTTRIIRGAYRNVTIKTFTGTTDDEYQAFRQMKIDDALSLDVDPQWRTGRSAPIVEIEGKPDHASYEFVTY